MATSRSVLRFVKSRSFTTFSALKIGLTGSKIVQSWSRISFQHAERSKLLHTSTKLLQIKSYSTLSNLTNRTLEQTTYQKLFPLTISTPVIARLLLLKPSMNVSFQRGVTLVSKKGKRKTCKAVAKRFIRTGKGKLKRWRCGYHHNQTKKSGRRKRFLRKPTYATKTQLKTLNKMLNGW